MDQLLNTIKGHSAAQDALLAQPRFAQVTSVDVSRSAVRVQLQPQGVLTGWLPVLSSWVGNGWGLSCPPSPGDQVVVIAQEGDAENGIVIGRAWSGSSAAPSTPVGEFWLVHQSGSSIRLKNDGTIAIQGDLHVSGEVFDRVGRLGALRDDYNSHTHLDSRNGRTSGPTPQDNGSGS